MAALSPKPDGKAEERLEIDYSVDLACEPRRKFG